MNRLTRVSPLMRPVQVGRKVNWIRFQSTVSANENAMNTALKNDTEIGEDDDTATTGMIKKQAQESLIYFDHIIPYTRSRIDSYLSMLFFPSTDKLLKARVLSYLGNDENKKYAITSMQPMKRDGGAFVKFQIPWNESIQDFNKELLKKVNQLQSTGLLNFFVKPRCFPVKGTPWIEDLRRFPSPKVKVAFQGPDLTQEELYFLFRRYGVISDIIPPKPDSKDIPRSSFIEFNLVRGAITAKNCLNGYTLNDTTLHIQFVPVSRENHVLNFIMNHQRISIPLLFAALTLLLFLIFEPIREFFVKEKITKRYSLTHNLYFRQFMDFFSSTTSKFKQLFEHHDRDDNRLKITELFLERVEKIKELKLWLDENVNTFIVIRGPRGSGKHEMVIDHALKGRENVLVLDCDKLIKARNDQRLILTLGAQIGYFPSFPWLNSLTNFVDLALQGLIGQKSGISESKEQQVKTMLNTALLSIRDLSLEQYGYQDVVSEEDDKVLKEEDYLQLHPECKPVIVIDRFQPSRKLNERNSFIYKEIAEWCANLVSMNIAHVIFITDDIGSQSQLTEALPNQVFKTSTLSDASLESARNFVLNQLQGFTASTQVLDKLDDFIKPLGGRMLDLQLFLRRIKSGESPQEAINEMIVQTSEQLTQVYFNKKDEKFNSSHAWTLMKKLADKDEIEFKEIALHPLFKSNPVEILTALESTELVTLVKDRGLIKSIVPGKPLFKSSFQNLCHDPLLYKDLEIKYNLELISFENKRIAKWVEEINKFGEFSDLSSNKIFKPRLEYLADKIKLSTDSITGAEKLIKDLGKMG